MAQKEPAAGERSSEFGQGEIAGEAQLAADASQARCRQRAPPGEFCLAENQQDRLVEPVDEFQPAGRRPVLSRGARAGVDRDGKAKIQSCGSNR